jgi:hypothetical protein
MPAFSLVRILTMLALLLMPLAMAGQAHAGGAMAHHAETGSAEAHRHEGGSHRQKGQEERRQQDGMAQCMIACAALPAAEAAPNTTREAPRACLYALPIAPISGLAPEAETPPPRFA